MKLHRLLTTSALSLLISTVCFSQVSPYNTSWKTDGLITAGGVGLSAFGLSLIKKKDGLTAAEVARLSKNDVNGFDRFAAGNYSESADKISYYPFYGSFAMPIAFLLNKNEGQHAGQILALYLETMSITGALYSITAGSINRSRPYVYSSAAPMDERTEGGARRSFFAGHTAATASATFFAAKVFSDFNPDSKAKPYIWAAAAIIPAAVAYYRTEAGMHFLSDNIVGYAVGAGVGILVPQLHKGPKADKLTVTPTVTPQAKYLTLTYNLK